MSLANSITQVAPLYNLVLMIIVFILFFILFKEGKSNKSLNPWRYMFAVSLIVVLEQILTILYYSSIISFSKSIFAILELIIISLFIYMVLAEKELIKSTKKRKKK